MRLVPARRAIGRAIGRHRRHPRGHRPPPPPSVPGGRPRGCRGGRGVRSRGRTAGSAAGPGRAQGPAGAPGRARPEPSVSPPQQQGVPGHAVRGGEGGAAGQPHQEAQVRAPAMAAGPGAAFAGPAVPGPAGSHRAASPSAPQVRGDGGAADQPQELRPAEGQAVLRHRQVRHPLAPTRPRARAPGRTAGAAALKRPGSPGWPRSAGAAGRTPTLGLKT